MQIDKLIARIRGQLEIGTPDLEARTLASEYSGLCQRARERLEQCNTLIRNGNDYAAFQIAEIEPDLLTLCSQLSFADSERWHTLCRERGLPSGFILDEQHILAVEGLYGKSIGENHPLYREYRDAMRTRDEDRALNILRSIVRINPDDPTARSELIRLSAKFIRESLHNLVKLLDEIKEDEAINLMGQMERFGDDDLNTKPEWINALNRRITILRQKAAQQIPSLIKEAESAKHNGQWDLCISSLAKVRTLERDHQLNLPEDVQSRLHSLENWAGELAAAHEATAAIKSHTQQLVTQWENLSESAQNGNSPVILISSLNDWLARAENFTEQLPPGLVDEVNSALKLSRLRLTRRYVLLISAWIAGFLLVVGTIFYAYRIQELKSEARRNFQEIRSLLEIWDTEVAAQKLASDNKNTLLTEKSSEFVDEYTEIKKEIQKQRESITSLRTEASYLQQAFKLGINLSNYAEINTHAKAYIQAVAQVGPKANAELIKICPDPAQILSTCQKITEESRTQLFNLRLQLKKSLGSNEKISDLPNAINTIEKIRPLILSLSIAGVKDLDEANAEIDRANIRITSESNALSQIQSLTQSSDLKLYLNALGSLIKNNTANSHLNQCAQTIINHSPKVLTLPRSVLAPHLGAMWDNIPKTDSSGLFQPGELSPFESNIVQALADTRTALSLRRYYVRQSSSEGIKKLRTVVISGEIDLQRKGFNGGIEYVLSAKELSRDGELIDSTWSRREFKTEKGDFISRGEDLVEETPLGELDYLRQFNRFFEVKNGQLSEPIIRKLDLVRRSTAPFFELRAYQLQELFKVANQRPEAWGILYSPSAQRDAEQLRRITQSSINSYDFLFREKWADVLGDLKSIFLRQGGCTYAEEARFWRSLMATLRTQKMIYVGFQSDEGEAILREKLSDTLIFGIDNEGKANVIYRVDADGNRTRINEPAPLSPLLRLSTTITEAAKASKIPANLNAPEGGWEVILLGRDL
jgi:hypothetical protein